MGVVRNALMDALRNRGIQISIVITIMMIASSGPLIMAVNTISFGCFMIGDDIPTNVERWTCIHEASLLADEIVDARALLWMAGMILAIIWAWWSARIKRRKKAAGEDGTA
ncbi:MAG: hypothetical protein MPK75_01965 [Alphaproteobacteria bacterium]|nr:hypothetical protein [Alphaproteobacteria bacterium]